MLRSARFFSISHDPIILQVPVPVDSVYSWYCCCRVFVAVHLDLLRAHSVPGNFFFSFPSLHYPSLNPTTKSILFFFSSSLFIHHNDYRKAVSAIELSSLLDRNARSSNSPTDSDSHPCRKLSHIFHNTSITLLSKC